MRSVKYEVRDDRHAMHEAEMLEGWVAAAANVYPLSLVLDWPHFDSPHPGTGTRARGVARAPGIGDGEIIVGNDWKVGCLVVSVL